MARRRDTQHCAQTTSARGRREAHLESKNERASTQDTTYKTPVLENKPPPTASHGAPPWAGLLSSRLSLISSLSLISQSSKGNGLLSRDSHQNSPSSTIDERKQRNGRLNGRLNTGNSRMQCSAAQCVLPYSLDRSQRIV